MRWFMAGPAFLMAMLAAVPAPAEVVHVEQNAFVVHEAADVAVPPAAVWAELVRPADWWDPAHTWSGDAANLTLKPEIGGCFCEVWMRAGNGVVLPASVRHMEVVAGEPYAMMRLSGGLGPLQGEAVAGTLTIRLAPAAGGHTALTWDYAVAGYLSMGGPGIAPAVDHVLGGLIARLAARAARQPLPAPTPAR